MKKLFLILAILAMAVSVSAAPFLVSDPVDPSTCGSGELPNCPTMATIYEDDVIIAQDVPVEADMSINYDLAGRPAGVHKYKAIYQDAVGGLSLESNPTMLGSDEPKNLRLTP